jgi:ATP-binding cassette, subfamily C (CFTR/MRP), member 1
VFFTDLVPRLACWQAARRMHNHLTAGVLRAPLTFFDTTPQGRVVGRFSKDIDVVDNSMPMYISDCVYCFFEVSAAHEHP